MANTAKFEADSPVFVPRKERGRKLVGVHFQIDANVWEHFKTAAKESRMSHGELAEQMFRYALDHLGD
jgi:hypothetical protein